MEQIQNQAIFLYEKNISYLQKSHPTLYEKIQNYNLLIAQNEYEENFALEYLDEYFDVQEIKTGAFLYGKNSLEFSNALTQKVDLKTTGGVFSSLMNMGFIDEKLANELENAPLHFHGGLWANAKIIANHCKITNEYLKQYKKFMFLNIGLGLHVQSIIQKLHCEYAFIKEENFEIFRLSLFVCDYENISQSCKLFFSIGSNPDEMKIFQNFLSVKYEYNFYIKFLPFFEDYDNILQTLQHYNLSQDYVSYPYNALLLKMIKAPFYLSQNKPFLNLLPDKLTCIFKNKPVLILASGPSSSKYLNELLSIKDKFTIISPISNLKFLQQNNITPDIIAHIDPQEDIIENLLNGVEIERFKDCICLFSASVPQKLVQNFQNSFFIANEYTHKVGFGYLGAPSIGEYLYALMLLLGANEIYLLGVDLALDSQTLQTHTSSHAFTSQPKVVQNTSNLHINDSVFYVKGNFENQVPTLSKFKMSIDQFEVFTNFYKKTQNVYNLSDGAYLEGAKPTKFSEIDLKNASSLSKSELNEYFKGISSDVLRTQDLAYFKQQLKLAKKLKNKIISHNFDNFDKIKALLHVKDFDLTRIYEDFLKLSLCYIFDIQNKNEDPKQAFIYLKQSILKITNTYIDSISLVVKT